MTTIVTRAGKGSPLTHTEVDTNFTNLNTAKLETAAIPLGTLQAPSVSFLNDSDTGIFCPQGGNSLAIATGAQYAITCTSTQAVGIKTANPQKALHVAGATRVGADDATDAFLEIGEGATGNRSSYIDIVGDTTYTDYGLRFIRNNTGANATSEIKHRGTGNLNFTTQEAGAIVFNTTNSPSVTITAGGNVGIGNSSPATPLDVVGNIRAVTSTTSATTVRIGNTGNNVFLGVESSTGGSNITGSTAYAGTITSNGPIQFSTVNGGSVQATLDASGRVGIGSTTLIERLHVNGGVRLDVDNQGLYFNSSTTSINGNGTSSYITFNTSNAEKARLNSSGRFLVGTSTAETWYASLAQIQYNGSEASFMAIRNSANTEGGALYLGKSRGTTPNSATVVQSDDNLGAINFLGADGTDVQTIGAKIKAEVDGTPGANDMPGRLVFSTTADGASSPTERMRIPSSGGLLINATSRIDSGLTTIGFDGAAQKGLVVNDTNPANTRQFIAFDINGTTQIGYIGNSNNTGVTYSTTSDYRLKENVTPVTDGIIRLQQLKPSRFNFIADPDRTVDGFIAHEAQAVVPECVTGEKDAVDEDGNPIYQGIDQSKLVPLLTAALQEAITKIESLEARLTAAGI